MRIAVVNNFFPPRPGGSSHLSDALAIHYARAGHEVIVITASYKSSPALETRDGLTIHRLQSWTMPPNPLASNFDVSFAFSRKNYKKMTSILDDFSPQIIHQHGQFFDLTWMSGRWAKKNQIPVVLSIHTRLESVTSKTINALYALGDRLLIQPIIKSYRPGLVVMDKLMDEYIDSRYTNAFSQKYFIPVGVDAEALRGGDATHVYSDSRLVGKKIIVSVGHVIPQRSRLKLVEALPEVIRSVPEAQVVVLGGLYDRTFLDRAKALGIEKYIIADGPVDRHTVRDYLAAADVEVHELEGCGFGTASLEALATGVPVVAAVDQDNFPQIQLIDRKHLYLVPFESKNSRKASIPDLSRILIEVLDNPQKARETVGQNGKDIVDEHFVIERVAQAHLEAFMRAERVH